MSLNRHIAVIGGGLTGLSSAFHLSRRFPDASITLFEKHHRLGGWVRSERVDVGPSQQMVLEAGPRTIRPSAKSILELVGRTPLENIVPPIEEQARSIS